MHNLQLCKNSVIPEEFRGLKLPVNKSENKGMLKTSMIKKYQKNNNNKSVSKKQRKNKKTASNIFIDENTYCALGVRRYRWNLHVVKWEWQIIFSKREGNLKVFMEQ